MFVFKEQNLNSAESEWFDAAQSPSLVPNGVLAPAKPVEFDPGWIRKNGKIYLRVLGAGKAWMCPPKQIKKTSFLFCIF